MSYIALNAVTVSHVSNLDPLLPQPQKSSELIVCTTGCFSAWTAVVSTLAVITHNVDDFTKIWSLNLRLLHAQNNLALGFKAQCCVLVVFFCHILCNVVHTEIVILTFFVSLFNFMLSNSFFLDPSSTCWGQLLGFPFRTGCSFTASLLSFSASSSRLELCSMGSGAV